MNKQCISFVNKNLEEPDHVLIVHILSFGELCTVVFQQYRANACYLRHAKGNQVTAVATVSTETARTQRNIVAERVSTAKQIRSLCNVPRPSDNIVFMMTVKTKQSAVKWNPQHCFLSRLPLTLSCESKLSCA